MHADNTYCVQAYWKHKQLLHKYVFFNNLAHASIRQWRSSSTPIYTLILKDLKHAATFKDPARLFFYHKTGKATDR